MICQDHLPTLRACLSSIIITSNLPFDEWTEVFGSERLTGAILDRLTHHVHILELNGDSFRLRQTRMAKKLKPGKLGNNQVGLRPTRLATRQLDGEHSRQGAVQRPTEWPTIPPVRGPFLLRD